MTADGRSILCDVNNIKKVGQASLLSQTVENDSRFGLPHSSFKVTEAPNTNLKVKILYSVAMELLLMKAYHNLSLNFMPNFLLQRISL